MDRDTEHGFVGPSGEAFRELVRVMVALRAPDGCPWDREQTHATLARHLLEETYEVLEAIDSGDLDALREELGDLALQVVFHSEIAFEEGAFTIADVLDELRAKLVRRHPHVFGDVEAETAEHVLANWERMKREEKGTGVMDGIPTALPALARAAKVHRRAVQSGFDFEGVGGVFTKVSEELGELRQELDNDDQDTDRIEAELGDVLFMVTSLAQHLGVEAETAMRKANERFERRFRAMEAFATRDGRGLESLSPDEWGRYWDQAKQEHP